MVNNTSNIERIEFFSKHTTNFPQTTHPYNHNTGILFQGNDLNGLEEIWVGGIGAKEKHSALWLS